VDKLYVCHYFFSYYVVLLIWHLVIYQYYKAGHINCQTFLTDFWHFQGFFLTICMPKYSIRTDISHEDVSQNPEGDMIDRKTIYPKLKLSESVEIGSVSFPIKNLPKPLVANETLGIVSVPALDGIELYRSPLRALETRGIITPGGDYLIMFPAGVHYSDPPSWQGRKTNSLLGFRSSDKGKTWIGPFEPLNINYNQHGFIPLIPKGSSQIYCFGTQPVFDKSDIRNGLHENAPIGYFYSDDDGYTWDGPHLIEPVNDPDYRGMSVMRMCETDAGTWLLGTHEGDWSYKPLHTKQYILRSEDKGKTWTLLPGKRPNGWYVEKFNRMDEGRPLNLGGGHVIIIIRTPEGHLWITRSRDDGKTWTGPRPTPLIHPDAPPMLELLPDKKTIVCFHHNRHHDTAYTGLSGEKEIQMKDRSEIWVSFSEDGGETWTEPGFLYCNALAPTLESPFRNNQCSYMDLFADGDILNMVVPHRWHEVLFMQIKIDELYKLPKKNEFREQERN
jgi:hypothetical protein